MRQRLTWPRDDGAEFTAAEIDGCSKEGCIVASSHSEGNEAIQTGFKFASLAPGNLVIGGLIGMPSWYAGPSPSTTGGVPAQHEISGGDDDIYRPFRLVSHHPRPGACLPSDCRGFLRGYSMS